MESLGYVLVYLVNGRLPWEDVKANTREEKHAKIKKMKMDMCAEVLCEGLPSQFGKFIRIARTLPFEVEPDYGACKKLFRDCLIEEGFGRDYIYDWTVIHYAMAGVPRTFKGTIPPCSMRCGGTPPPPPTFEPPKLGHPDPPRPPPKKVQIPQGRLHEFSPNKALNDHRLYIG
ncbi:hypothetical protein M758_3G137100 [Ceratodon purpureus]|nr:hypothetical protein M758_3G137100 [Ceratodon purpureus]